MRTDIRRPSRGCVAAGGDVADGMQVRINGEVHDVEATTVEALLQHLALPLERVALERNGVIVRRADRATTPVVAGDVFEIVTLVGGG
jgi:thiamine biosynthesis protein ThiS